MTATLLKTDFAYTRYPQYKPLLVIPGPDVPMPASGVLTGLAVAGANNYHYFRVTVDGSPSPVVDQFLCGTSAGLANNGLTLNVPFKSRLVVEIADRTPSALPQFWACCVLDGCEVIDRGEPTKKEFGGIQFAYEQDVIKTPEGKKYTIEYSVGGWKKSQVFIEPDTLLRGKKVEGRVRLSDWQDKPQYAEDVNLECRVLGKETRIGEPYPMGSFEWENTFIWPLNVPVPGSYEIITTVPGFVNIPAVLLIL